MAAEKFTALAIELEKDILTGKYGWEGGLPTVSELAQKWNMSINTIRNALSILDGKGLVEKRGASYYVRRIPFVMTQGSPSAYMTVPRGEYYQNIGSVKRITLPEYMSEKLNSPQYGIAVYRVQVSGEVVEGHEHPLQISYRYHLMPVSDDKIQRMQDDPAYDPMWDDESTPNDLQSHDEITARLATDGERDLLSLPESSTIIHLFEAIRDKDNNLLIAQEVVLSQRESLIFDFSFVHRPS
jgi:DNA-binding GntR family transcriptional regulator